MRLKPNDPRLNEPNRPRYAPLEYAGKWVAWDDEKQNIVAHGDSAQDAYAQAIALGVKLPLLQKVARADAVLIGGA
jgi:hypothetical protein